MLEKNLFFHTHEDVFPDSCNGNSNRFPSGIEGLPDCFFSGSDNNPVNPDFSADNPTSIERGSATHDNTHPHSRGNISQMKYDLSSCVNNWHAVENLDDVDKVLRNCDSTLELGGTGNDHELSWQSLSHAVEEPEDMWTSNFSFFHPELRSNQKNTVEYGPSKSNNRSSSANDSNKDSASMSSRSCTLACEGGDSTTFDYSNFTNPSHALSVTEEETMLSEPVDFSEELQCNQSDGKRQNQWVENFGLFHNNGSIRSVDLDLPFGNSSCPAFTSSDIQRQKNSTQFDPFGYFLNSVPQMQVDYSCSDQIQASPPSSEMKSGSTLLTSFPLLETSSYGSNQVPSTGRSCGRSFEAPAESANDDKGSRERGFCPKYMNSHATSGGVQENSCMSTGFGEVSMEESQFFQLQQIVAQLDTGTKLSIRDGLFRLARSAEQRQKHAISDSCSINDRDTGGTMITGGINKHNGFLDMETDTNQIDRSIAHLLFHRP